MNEQLAADLAVTGNEVSVGEIEERTNPRTPLEMRADYFINRELSWLAFNGRVLEEAHNPPPAARAAALPLHLGQQPRRVLHGPRRRPQRAWSTPAS